MQTKADDDERLRKHLAEETIQVGLKAEAAAAIRETERLQREEATKLAERQRFEEALLKDREEARAREKEQEIEQARAREKEQDIEQARKAAASFEEVHTPSSPQSQVFLGTLTPLS